MDINEKDTVEIKGLDEEETSSKLTLISQEGIEFVADRKVCMHSELIKTMVEGDKNESDLPLPNVKGPVLRKVLEFLEYNTNNPMKEIEKPLKSSNMKENVNEWYADFCDIEQEQLFELILAANYMDIPPLLSLTCAKVASIMKGKTPEQIRQQFNIQNDFSPEEYEVVCKEFEWAEPGKFS